MLQIAVYFSRLCKYFMINKLYLILAQTFLQLCQLLLILKISCSMTAFAIAQHTSGSVKFILHSGIQNSQLKLAYESPVETNSNMNTFMLSLQNLYNYIHSATSLKSRGLTSIPCRGLFMAYVLSPIFESQFFLADRRALPGHQRCVSGADAAHNVASST